MQQGVVAPFLISLRATIPGMVVADDEAHAARATLDETPDERRPGRALVVAGGPLETEHPAWPSFFTATLSHQRGDTTRAAITR